MRVEDREASPTSQATTQPCHLRRSAVAAPALHFRRDFLDCRCDFRDHRCSVAAKATAVTVEVTIVVPEFNHQSHFRTFAKEYSRFRQRFRCFRESGQIFVVFARLPRYTS